MFRFFALLLSFCSVLNTLLAQDIDIAAGINAYSLGENEKAISLFEKALSGGAVEETKLAEIYYYQARSKLSIYQDAVATNDPQVTNDSEPYFFGAYADYRKAQSKDQGEWDSKIMNDLRVVFSNALQSTLSSINKSYSQSNQSLKNDLVNRAERMIQVALEINNDYYIAHDLYGQVLLEQGKIQQSIEEFNVSQKLYPNAGEVDFLIAYTYYRSAISFRRVLNDLQSALDELQEGLALVDNEYDKLISLGKKSPENEEQYRRAKSALKNLELDIYLNYPEKLTEALNKFEEDTRADPNNYQKMVAYGSLLEKSKPLDAIDVYMKAIEIDPTRETANFNLGVLYNNLAADLSDQARNKIDLNEASALNYKAKDHMANALIYFEKAYDVNPSLKTVLALKQISKFLKMEEKHQFYAAKELQMLNK